jgi:DNA-binding XRE family transcriptional regulator
MSICDRKKELRTTIKMTQTDIAKKVQNLAL